MVVIKPKARPRVLVDGSTFWYVRSCGIVRGDADLREAYRKWVEEYFNMALYYRGGWPFDRSVGNES